MPLTTQTPAQFVSAMQSTITSLTSRVKNFSTGSVMGALTNALASQLIFLQQQAITIVNLTRAASSTGADLTSFVADYGLSPTRVAAVNPSGQAVFTKIQAPTVQQVIPVGTIIQTRPTPPTVPTEYTVIADTTNVNYSATLNGYILAAGSNTVSCTVQGTSGPGTGMGTALNVLAGQLSSIAVSGVPADSVSNPNDIVNGVDQETDAALRVRFTKYISSLPKCTSFGLASAILNVLPGATYVINDGLGITGSTQSAFFTAVVDDGSGAIPAGSLSTVLAALNLARAAGISCAAIAPTNVTITVAVSGTVIQPGFVAATVRSAIQAAIIAYINSNGVGGANVGNSYVPSGSLSFAGVAAVVGTFIGSGAAQGLSSYSAITVNSGTANIALTNYQLARTSSSSVTVS